MRLDLVVQVIVDYGSFCENFASRLEAENFIGGNIGEMGLPVAAWLEDVHGNRKWDYDILEDDGFVTLSERVSDPGISAPLTRWRSN